MSTILIAYGTGTGQTAKVAHFVDDVLTERGHTVTTRHVSNVADLDLEAFDGVLVGGPINNNRHQTTVVEFVEQHREVLDSRPSGLFQLSFAAALPWERARSGALEWAEALSARTGWTPDRVGSFAGAVNYTQYTVPLRLFFRAFSAITTGDTDTSRDYEYTDWERVERFALEFVEFVESGAESTRPSSWRRPSLRPGTAGRCTRRAPVALLGLVAAAVLYRRLAGRDREY